MSHPFELELSDLKAIELDFVEQLTDEEAKNVQGGFQATTHYVTAKVGEAAEEGGGGPVATTHYITANVGEAAEEGGGLSHY